MSIKIVVQAVGAAASDNYTFTFTSPSARAEQIAITDILRKCIEASRAQSTAQTQKQPPAQNDSTAQSAAMAIAQAVTSTGRKDEDSMLEVANLISNIGIQRSLLNANPNLQQRFEQALREKPDSITISQFSSQFWASRVHLLREHAVEKAQMQGSYNVLSELKPRNADGETRLRLSREQIQLIFRQHPLVKRVYNENVPQLSEQDFWSRFFGSRLFKKLKGEKITDTDSVDPKLDRYLNMDEDADRAAQVGSAQVPHFIDLEGNEQNHSQRQGNRPDFTMQPNSHEKVPILRVLNSMSEKMMAAVEQLDASQHGPVGMNEEAFEELRLRDLQREDADNRILLKINDQKRFVAARNGDHASREAKLYSEQKPSQVLSVIRGDLGKLSGSQTAGAESNLQEELGVRENSSSDEEDGQPSRSKRVGSRLGRATATKQIVGAVRQRRAETDEFTSQAETGGGLSTVETGLSTKIIDSLITTHNTTIEFLHYFWTVFLSGDADRAVELQKLVETLDKSLDRIKAIEGLAEQERRERIDRERQSAEEYQKRTGRKRKVDSSNVRGGAKVVGQMMTPTIRSINAATTRYKEAYEVQASLAAQ